MDKLKNELKPCPFCGSDILEMDREDRLFDNHAVRWFVTCYSCPCSGVIADTRDEAVKAWNTRDNNIESLLEIAEAVKFLVEVKDHKDTKGKDEWYKGAQPVAWRQVREALSKVDIDRG